MATLTVINYSMHSDSMVFSHQRDIVLQLSNFFETVHVFTNERDYSDVPENVEIKLIGWRSGRPFYNFYKIIRVLGPHLLANRGTVIFSHMTEVHSAVISPLTWLLGIKHVLWYAHAKTSPFLFFASFFVSQILTSTQGSCTLPVNKWKIQTINQGVDVNLFPFRSISSVKISRLIYYGRLDKAKNIHLFLDVIIALHKKGKISTFDIFGKSAGTDSWKYLRHLESTFDQVELGSKLKFCGPLLRREIAHTLKNYDVFINLFVGSLDKTLIESTMTGLPVVTWNAEYCRSFGTWSGVEPAQSIEFILLELLSIESLDIKALDIELRRRRDFAQQEHSLSSWILALLNCLTERVDS